MKNRMNLLVVAYRELPGLKMTAWKRSNIFANEVNFLHELVLNSYLLLRLSFLAKLVSIHNFYYSNV